MQTAILLIECQDRPGIVTDITRWVSDVGANILRLDQHSTAAEHGVFFMRIKFTITPSNNWLQKLRQAFTPLATELNAHWSIHDNSRKPKIAVLVSKHLHCLQELLFYQQNEDLAAEIVCVISNHHDAATIVKAAGIEFHYLPITPANKSRLEQQLLQIVQSKSDCLVLARYMQILSDDFIAAYKKDIVNIHHSFLPSFMGANPYQQAYDRGVKIIGATAHYATADLDEGPIIAQQVAHVSHQHDVDTLKRKGKILERNTLLEAVQAHIDYRVIRYGDKTIVFDE